MRAIAAQVLEQVIDKRRSLSQVLPEKSAILETPQDKARLQEICYGSLRYLRQLQFFTNELVEKPLKKQFRLIEILIYSGIYQLQFMRTKQHAVVSETVEAVSILGFDALKSLVNGVMRSFLRQQQQLNEKLSQYPQIDLSYPNWLYEKIDTIYSEKAVDVMRAGNQYPPMWLRVNQQKSSTAAYMEQLANAESHPEAACAILLEKPMNVAELPNFEDGWVSVQDAAAQLSVNYLQPKPNERILDCCCAPGGKTCHILEAEPDANVIAVDIEETRLTRVRENLERLGLNAEVVTGDANQIDGWWDGEKFDRILLDAPCSATGVIRRHPDIKWLRKKTDIPELVQVQANILENAWTMLKDGGRLVYATCSILPEENHMQISNFLSKHNDAELIPDNNISTIGRQILPGENGMDGFYYAALLKTRTKK